MAVNINPVFPVTPVMLQASLAAASACTTRAPVASANIAASPNYGVELKYANASSVAGTYGRRIDRIQVKGIATAIGGATTAGTVIIWCDDGVNAWPITEILTPVVTPSASVASIDVFQLFSNLVLPPSAKLWASTTIAANAAAHALAVYVYGGDY